VLQCVAVCCSVGSVYLRAECRDKAPSICCARHHHVLRRGVLKLCVAACVLQCVAVCCSVLQCVAVCCSVLHSVGSVCLRANCRHKALPTCCARRHHMPRRGLLQSVAVCCSLMQFVAVCCSMLQRWQCLSESYTPLNSTSRLLCASSSRAAARCVAVCCSVLQCVATCCSVL